MAGPFRTLTRVTRVYVWEKQLVPGPGIVHAPAMGDMAAGVLPELASLHLSGYHNTPSTAKATQKFRRHAQQRRLSARTIYCPGERRLRVIPRIGLTVYRACINFLFSDAMNQVPFTVI